MMLSNPKLLWLLALLPVLTAWYVWKQRNLHAAMAISTTLPFRGLRASWKTWMRHVAWGLQMLALGCVVVVLCRPQTTDSWRTSSVDGTDIIVALDISSSMLARDFKPDRFEAAKTVAARFVNGRRGDNMGLVTFAAESFTSVPMTTDRAVLANSIHGLKMGMLDDGTAIGDGLATAINRVRSGQAKSKSIILLTDGSNNTGNVAPLTAAEIAAQNGIKVYTIGVGTNGTAPYPQQDFAGRTTYVQLPVVIDEATLKQIASVTGGKYFRATSSNVLQQVFDEIDKLETTRMNVKNFTHTEDAYMPWALCALGLYLLALLLRTTVLRTIP